MTLHLPEPNGNPWPKSWGIQIPIISNNISQAKPSHAQKTLKIVYKKDLNTFKKYYNKTITQVICSGIQLSRSLGNRCKLVKSLELYEHAQIKSKFFNLKSVKLGRLSEKKTTMKAIKRVVHDNKSLRNVWIDRYETMKVLAHDLKFPRQLNSFSLGLFNCSKEQMNEKMRFLNRYCKLKQVALCSTEPQQQVHPRAIEAEARDFVSFLGALFKKISLKGIKLDLMDPQVIEKCSILNDFILSRLNQDDLDHFDLRLAITQFPSINEVVREMLKRLDYFALSINGAPLQKNTIWTEEILRHQKNSNRSFMVDLKSHDLLDLNPLLTSISSSLKSFDLSFNGDHCSFGVNWSEVIPRFTALENLSLNFISCSALLSYALPHLTTHIKDLPSLKSIAVHLENIDFSEEIYKIIDDFYLSIQHIPEHTLNLEASQSKDIQIDSICRSLNHLRDLKSLKLIVHLGPISSIQSIGDLVKSLSNLEKLDLHVRLDMHTNVAFNLPLEELSNLHHLRIELLFRPDHEFVSQLNSNIIRLKALEHLELNILFYTKISYALFKNLLAKLNLLKDLKGLEMSVNIEDENAGESLVQKNLKLRKELQGLLSQHPSLNKIMFHQFVSIICCTR